MAISKKIVAIPAFKDNYIWLFFDEISRDAWVVDPGDAKPVMLTLKENKLNLSGIFLTHHHYDHSGGINDLRDHWKNAIVYGAEQNTTHPTHPVKEGETIVCSNITFQVLAIPGHTLDHMAYVGNNVLFCGDTLFSAGCGRLFEGTARELYHSLEKLADLDEETQIYCGHEYTLSNLYFAQHVEPTNPDIVKKIETVKQALLHHQPSLPSLLKEEKKINPFLRCDQPTIIESVSQHANKKLTHPIDVFTELRLWKNHFTTGQIT